MALCSAHGLALCALIETTAPSSTPPPAIAHGLALCALIET